MGCSLIGQYAVSVTPPKPKESCPGCGAQDFRYDERKRKTVCTFCGRTA